MDQIVSLTNFSYKVRLKEGVTDDFLVAALRAFNEDKGEKQFHSVCDGVSTRLFHPPPPRARPPPASVLVPAGPSVAQVAEGFLVLEGPPFHLKLEDLKDLTDRLPGTFTRQWVVGPSGSTCVLITFSHRVIFTPPRFFAFEGVNYRLKFFSSPPAQYAPPLAGFVSLGSALMHVCAAASSVVPEGAARSVLSVINSYPADVLASLVKVKEVPSESEVDEDGDVGDSGVCEGDSAEEGDDGEEVESEESANKSYKAAVSSFGNDDGKGAGEGTEYRCPWGGQVFRGGGR